MPYNLGGTQLVHPKEEWSISDRPIGSRQGTYDVLETLNGTIHCCSSVVHRNRFGVGILVFKKSW